MSHATPAQLGPQSTSPPLDKLISSPGAPQASQFQKGELTRAQLNRDPFAQFHAWFKHALDAGIAQCEACTLSTAALPSGRVSARIVYLKELDRHGFVVYSNWGTSRKAADVRTNAHGALTFWWRELERQVRVEGTLERLTAGESQGYFDTRIRGSRIGAWASAQSAVLAGRGELERRVGEVEERFEGVEDIPVPEFWGGARLRPESVEFWQGRESRLHDRFRYSKEGEEWKIERLSP
jgi:pyridoxamine 5'-phosphate oxidase